MLILDNLPYLNFLNGKTTKEENYSVDIEDNEIESISLNDEITNFNYIFSKICEKVNSNSLDPEKNQKYLEEFQNLLKREINKINQAVDSAVPNYIYATNVISSKILILKYFQNKYLEYMESSEIEKESTFMIKELGENIFKSSEFLISKNILIIIFYYLLFMILFLLLLLDIIFSLYPKIDEKTSILKKELDNAMKTSKVSDTESFKYDEKIKQLNREKDFLTDQHNEEKNILLQKIEALENENKIITEKLIQTAKDRINYSNSNNYNYNNINLNSSAINNSNGKRGNLIIEEEMPNKEINNNINNNNNNVNKNNYINNTNINPNGTITETINKTKIGNIFNSTTGGSKVLTLKMMKDMITEIYNSKEEYDKKCLENKVPKETMEQHMYSYLNHKYGLKSLIIEWASNLINGIKTYSIEDSEINLFGKVKKIKLNKIK